MYLKEGFESERKKEKQTGERIRFKKKIERKQIVEATTYKEQKEDQKQKVGSYPISTVIQLGHTDIVQK